MEILQFVADSLGDASYLVISGDSAAVVDPQRDVRPFVQAAESRSATIRFVFETHVHNDYLSGGRELAALGAKVVVPAGSGIQFPHIDLADSAEIEVGGAKLRAIAAPGHTFEHTAYIAANEHGQPAGAFTGGALLMAAAGRSDLLGPGHAQELALLQWQTARRLAAALPPTAEILPTHGAGSFCSTTGNVLERRGPLSVELARNPVLIDPLEDFRREHLSSLPPIPGYYRYMAPINRKGPEVFGQPPAPSLLEPDAVAAALRTGTLVVDVRSRKAFIAGHIPGSVHIPDSGSFLAYVGWLVPFNAPLVLIATDQAQADRLTADLFRIGYERVRGYLPWAAWTGRETERLETVTATEARTILAQQSRPVLDVRFTYEQEQRPLPGAQRLPVDALPEWLSTAPDDAVVICASGERATIAASMLQQAGKRVSAFARGGAEDLLGSE